VILSTNKGGQIIISVLFSYGPNKAFLVSDSCRVTERNGNRISADVTNDANEND
jgi:hypothetical protein